MSGITATGITGMIFMRILIEYDRFISGNYKKLSKMARTICNNNSEYEDILNNNLIKIRQRIKEKGFHTTVYDTFEQSITGYIYMAILNDYKLKIKRANRNKITDIDDLNENEVHERLMMITESQFEVDKTQEYYQKVDYTTKKMFEYLEIKYPAKQVILFKTYYLTNSNTYNKLSKVSELDKKTISNQISMMKKDLRENLVRYINNTRIEN